MELSSRLSGSGISDLEILSEDSGLVLGRGRRDGAEGQRSDVLVVLPASEQPNSATLDRLTHEFALRDEFDGAWAARPLDLLYDPGRTALVLEDRGGELLSGLVGAPMQVGAFLRLAVGIAGALAKVHQRGLIHKDIKPGNILVNAASGEVWLTGFGIASRLLRERQPPDPPEIIAGTLAYMAPEQTGRMNRSIDSRSDLYSLGVTFYEMLTGGLPFAASDPMEWVHCHIARQAQAPGERVGGIPDVLSSVVMKLLAKTAEERYQTAAGVEADLRRCMKEWQAHGRIDPFPPGAQDASDRLLIPEKLYGREREIATLLASFDRVVAGGRPELVLVSGYSGIGKSSVVNELHKPLVPPRGYFASGKFDQYKRDIPYATLAQAFQSLIRPILAKNEEELSRWRDALAEALGPNGQLMVDLVPELKLIIGEQPPVTELPPRDAQKRFQLVFRRFIGAFTREHPLALFLDDLQWLDAATLDLMEDLLTHPDVKDLLLIGAYRDNEVDSTHPLTRKLQAMHQAGAMLQNIVLAPLARHDLEQLIADSLRCELGRTGALPALVEEKTSGNPFFVIQFISALFEEGLLTFDHIEGRWDWDLDRILAIGYTDNVVELMVGKLSRLPGGTQKALQRLACLGNSADFAMLRMIYQDSSEEMHGQLWEAVRTGLIFRSEDSYRFLHDRVQEAAYSLIPSELRADVHVWIGRLLVADTPSERHEEIIFEIVNQFNRGTRLITSESERLQVAEFNLMAGKRAQASSAYVSALTYLTTGIGLLTNESWRQKRELCFALELATAHCEFASGAIEKAETGLLDLSVRAATTAERVAVACLQVDLYQAIGRSDEAVAVGLRSLRQLGFDFPEHPTEADAHRAYERIRLQLEGVPIEDLVNRSRAHDPDSAATLELLISVAIPMNFLGLPHLFAVIICSAVRFGLERGHSDISCFAYAQLGSLVTHFGHFDAGYRFGRLACELAERSKWPRFQARAFQTFGIIMPWTQPVRKAREFLFRGFDLASRTGEISYAGYASNQLNTNYLVAGDSLIETQEQAERGLAFVRKAGSRTVEASILGQLGLIRSLRGMTDRLGSFDEAAFLERDIERDLAGKPALALSECWYYIRKLQARFFAGEYADGLRAASKARTMVRSALPLLEFLEYHFYGALCLAAVHDLASPEDREHHRAGLTEHLKKLDTWALHCPENFAGRAALVGAEVARIEGRDIDAMRLYEEAIRSSRDHGFVQNEAIAYEVAARFYHTRGFEKFADYYLREARVCYLRWGADGKVRQLDRLYPHLAVREGQRPAAVIGSPVADLDVASVVKASQAVSSEIVLPKLIEQLMKIAIENAGADRGLLILPSGDEYLIQAEARAAGERIDVTMQRQPISATACPELLVRYVIRVRESVILDDASKPNLFSADGYLRDRQSKSILCLPLVKQRELTGILLLENTLASHAFTPARIAVLELLAAQAAISLENTRLYGDLAEREAKVRRLVDSNIIGVCIFDFDGRVLEANDAFLRIVEYDRDDVVSDRLRWRDLTPPEWTGADDEALAELADTGICRPYEKEYFRKDGSRVPVLMAGANFDEIRQQGVAFALDLTERKQAETALREAERRNLDAQMQLAHANRITTMGQLAASIAHEVNQPIGATLMSAETALRFLAMSPPKLENARQSLARIIADSKRGGEIIGRIRDLARNVPVRAESLQINGVVLEVIGLTRNETSARDVRVRTRLADDLPDIRGDRVQLQQVILNLIMNALEAMSEVDEESRELSITSARDGGAHVRIAVSDSGPGLPEADRERLFDAFYTTKASGLGMGLSICRSIVDAHGGRLWAEPNEPKGTVFCFTVPIAEKAR